MVQYWQTLSLILKGASMELKHELVIPNADLPFRMFIFEGKEGNYRVPTHWHRSLELFLVLEGAIDFYMDSRYHRLENQDFVIVNTNEVHSIESPTRNTTVVLQIPMETFEDYMKSAPYITFSKKGETENRKLIHLVKEMYQEYEKKEFGYELKVRGLFFLFLHLLVTVFRDSYLDPEQLKEKNHLDKLGNITEYMKQNYNKELSLEEVAHQFGFSPTYLSRIFRRYAKVNYRTYLVDLRVKYSVKELLHTDHTIGDIAAGNGFADSRAFSKAFVKRYGCLPSQYRRRIKEERRAEQEISSIKIDKNLHE